jgi:hypothetical protein
VIAPSGSGNNAQLNVQQYSASNSLQKWYFCDLNGNVVDPAYAKPAPAPTLSSIAVTKNPTKTEYTVGETLATAGLTLTATYSDKSTKTITTGFTPSPTTLSTAGTQTTTVTYEGKTASFTVTVKDKVVEPEPEPEPEQPPVVDGAVTIPGVANGIKLSAIMTKVGVKFDWTPSDSTYGYRIYRSAAEGSEGISITDFPIVGNEYVDVNIKPETQYYYTIRAVQVEASFNIDTVEVTPEVLSAPSEVLSIASKEIITIDDDTEARHFILMQINNPVMQVDREKIEIDPGRGTVPFAENGRTLVPIGAIITNMGGTASWNGEEKKISISSNGHDIFMWVGRKDILVDDATAEMDIAPRIVNERTLLPLRFVIDSVGCQAEYIGSTKQIVIVFYTSAGVEA